MSVFVNGPEFGALSIQNGGKAVRHVFILKVAIATKMATALSLCFAVYGTLTD